MSAVPTWAWWLLGLAAALAAFVATLPWIVQGFFHALLWPRYRIRVVGEENVPKSGPALIASNHVSWIDGFLLAAAFPRRAKALVNASYINFPVLGWVARRAGLIPVPMSGPRGQRAAIEATRKAFDRGEAVGIFPEAQLSRNGLLGPFYRGLEVMLHGREADVPVIPVYLDNLWGSLFSNSGGRFLFKRPKGFRRTVTVCFGPAVKPPVTAFAVRQAVQEASVAAYTLRRKPGPLPETIDLSLAHFEHPDLGLLAVSTLDFDRKGIHQTGQKPGSVGQAAPGVALRIVDESGNPLPPDSEGKLQALVAGREGWIDTGRSGSLDREGFLRIL